MQTNPRTLMFVEVKWVSDCCLRPSKQFISYVCMVRTSYIRWEDDFYFVLDQPAASLDFYGTSSLKQPSTSWPHLDMLLNSWSQPVCALTPWCCMLSWEAANIYRTQANHIMFAEAESKCCPILLVIITFLFLLVLSYYKTLFYSRQITFTCDPW